VTHTVTVHIFIQLNTVSRREQIAWCYRFVLYCIAQKYTIQFVYRRNDWRTRSRNTCRQLRMSLACGVRSTTSNTSIKCVKHL